MRRRNLDYFSTEEPELIVLSPSITGEISLVSTYSVPDTYFMDEVFQACPGILIEENTHKFC